jgi:hypothetical protein
MSLHKNRVKMTVSGTPGAGTVTLGSASTAYQSFASAYGANATVDVLYTDAGNAWGIERDCSYVHSGTTLGRGTYEASSTGSNLSLTSAAVVSVILSAGAGQQLALDHVALADANTTMVVGSMYVGSMAAWATADRTYTLPTTANVGDRIGVMITGGNATYELILTAATSDTLNGVAGGTEWSRLFITNETIIMRCVTANTAWVVEYDGRIPCHSAILGTFTSTASGSAQQLTYTATEEKINVGNVSIAASEKVFSARRAANVEVTVSVDFNSSAASTKYIWPVFRLNGGASGLQATIFGATRAGGSNCHASTQAIVLAAGDYLDVTIEQNDSTSEAVGYVITGKEIL